MSTRMLIDARHTEETRVTVVKGSRVEEFDYESATRRQLKGNIYLARVTRVEPSLQAAFVEYGGNRHGFLAFSEIHPDYYQIPVEDRQQLIEAETTAVEKAEAEELKGSESKTSASNVDASGDEAADEHGLEDATLVQDSDEDEKDAEIEAAVERRRSLRVLKRKYNIQEVIKRRQVLLVQVVKEERGNKGAALTTYLSLAGRYCVLMPNSTHSGGISRKISSAADRKRLKQMISDLEVPDEMGLIVRTAGMQRTKAEVKRDYDYLLRLWNGIRDLTLKSVAPTLVYEEGNLIKRTIRDLYTRDIDEILVEGEAGYRAAKDFMKLLMPSHAKKVQHYKDRIPLFHRYQVESHLEAMYQPVVQLRSGGYIVINPTEALISIDVNSGRATKEHNIEETALKTNMEAAEEIARQLRLRDMAGLIVIDFIDMEERNNNRNVERRMKDVLKNDRARIQVGRISSFGLMEMSRQRLRPNLIEASMETCHACAGMGVVRSVESAALMVLRQLEEEGIRGRSSTVRIAANPEVAIYLLNKKRSVLMDLETSYNFTIEILATSGHGPSDIEITREVGTGGTRPESTADAAITPESGASVAYSSEEDEDLEDEIEEDEVEEKTTQVRNEGEDDKPRKKRRRRRRRRRPGEDAGEAAAATTEGVPEGGASEDDEDASEGDTGETAEARAEGRSRRRRGSRGGRRRREGGPKPLEAGAEQAEGGEETAEGMAEAATTEVSAAETAAPEGLAETEAASAEKPRRRRRRAAKPETSATADAEATPPETAEAPEAASEAAPAAEPEAAPKPAPRRRTRKKADTAEAPAATDAEAEPVAVAEAITADEQVAAKPARKPRRTRKPADEAAAPEDAPKKPAAKPAAKAASKPAAKPAAKAKAKPAAEEASKPAEDKPQPAPAAKAEKPAPVDKPVQKITVGTESAETGGGETEPTGPKRKGWWQRTFG